MGHVRYEPSLYRTGFRPMTDPFAASQMSGIFKPERLHGVFTPSGGEALHGLGDLGAMVPNGAVVVYQGKWPLTQWTGAQDILNAVVAAISQDGSLAVRNSTSDASWTQNTPPFPVNTAPFGVTLQLQVVNGQGFGDPNDIISIIRHWVYQITGQFPIADSVPSVQASAAFGQTPGDPTATGQPAIVGAPSVTGTDWGTWLQNNLVWIAAAAVGFVVLPKVLGR